MKTTILQKIHLSYLRLKFNVWHHLATVTFRKICRKAQNYLDDKVLTCGLDLHMVERDVFPAVRALDHELAAMVKQPNQPSETT